ncbi:MAG: FeoA family protein [Aminobacterium sp.]|uniref:Ferrous iron transporter FeoA-like domain-containing protein n=1 Tax=bioreactor metagenome TaxID=1076179 RepID=A0A645F7S8_9ZZZZ|nr:MULTISPECIES: FeoA family protein [unclassified Aminobacterium]MDD2206991.1 FeoA family protein [Aminobacterium sp.]MDD3425739.1 FeoA family protein [Aminobacterium sp.]MDD3707696.1 FeoA family protein [Aminobacterium sp.]MDD4551868.1 FeoA family protein [Aminobacterium sp.]MEA4876318.1 FeoA family protein [Aminobacterium sp.]
MGRAFVSGLGGMITLDEMKPGEHGVIHKNRARGVIGQRLMDLGFFPGVEVFVIRNAPLVDPVEIKVDGHHVTIRHDEARFVEVEK